MVTDREMGVGTGAEGQYDAFTPTIWANDVRDVLN